MTPEPILCQNRKLKSHTQKIEFTGPCGEIMEGVELSILGTVLMCPKCDRQPGYKVDMAA